MKALAYLEQRLARLAAGAEQRTRDDLERIRGMTPPELAMHEACIGQGSTHAAYWRGLNDALAEVRAARQAEEQEAIEAEEREAERQADMARAEAILAERERP